MVSFRKATSQDVHSVYTFICQLEETVFELNTFREIFNQAISDQHAVLLIAEINGVAVGYASCFSQLLLHHNGRVGEIQEMYVAKDHQGQNIGKMLLLEIESLAKKQNWKGIEVTANNKRSMAHTFYKNQGFEQTHYKFTKEI
jgi:PhnO protein